MPENLILTGWGRTSPSRGTVHLAQAHAASRLVTNAGPRGIIARGLGRSYGDAAQNAGGDVMLLDPHGDISVDEDLGIASVGAGVPLHRLIQAVLPRGYFVPVTPGTSFVTVGGAIAADIHGKNHHVHGSFGEHVLSMELLDACGAIRTVSPTTDAELFWATVGGMGLTGVLLSATIRLLSVESSVMSVDTDRAANLSSLMQLMREGDSGYTYSVAWIDLLAQGAGMGRAVLTRATHAPGGRAGAPRLRLANPRLSSPPWAPRRLINPVTVRAFNELWFRKSPRCRRDELQKLTSFFYPLDGIAHWNRLYGRNGLLQYQCVVPFEAESALPEIVDRIARRRSGSFLAVLKRFGSASPGLLSFPRPGWTLAVDFRADRRLASMLDELDEFVASVGGRVYLAKDSRTRPEVIERMYPQLERFRMVRARVDPRGVFASDLDRRLCLSRKKGATID